MKRADDIYHEDNLPSLARRGMSRRHRKKRTTSSSRKTTRSSSQIRHHRSGGNNGSVPYARKMIVAVLCVIALVYVAFLINSFRSGGAGEVKGKEMISAGNEAGDILSEINGGPDLDDVQQLIRNSSQMNEDLVRVYTMLDAGHLDGAYQKIQQAVQNRPEDVSVKKALAAIYSGQEQHEKAANILMEVLQSNADDSEARISLMHVLAALRNYEGVLVVTDWLLADDPYATEIHHAAALASLELDETPQAIIHLKRIIEIDAQNRVARNLLGVAYRRQGAYEKAIKLFTEQLAMDDVDSSVYYNLAVCYAQRHQAQKSVEYLSKAVDLFGASFVKAWLQSDNFDAVRNDSSFMALNNSLAGKTSSAP